MTVPLPQSLRQVVEADSADDVARLHPVKYRAIAHFIGRRFDHEWIARQCNVPVRIVRAVEHDLLKVRP